MYFFVIIKEMYNFNSSIRGCTFSILFSYFFQLNKWLLICQTRDLGEMITIVKTPLSLERQ